MSMFIPRPLGLGLGLFKVDNNDLGIKEWSEDEIKQLVGRLM